MIPEPFTPITPARLDWQQGTPVALDYDDPYFSRQDGVAESRYVFLQGNRLNERFAALQDDQYLLIGETGFGTGLNCLLAAQLFLQQAPEQARLQLVSVEKHPLSHSDMAIALASWPDLTELAQALLAQYPAPVPGPHRLRLHPRIDLTLLYGDAETQWQQWQHPVDAWMLDGFAPARNPDMWQPGLFAQLARLSRPGTTLATFTAAGFVRRGLQAVGFSMEKLPGYGHKRHMLGGEFTAEQRQPARTLRRGHALVVGAGLAGASSARALAERGWQVTVLDPQGVAQGASGNLAGVVYSSPSPHMTPQNRFYQASYSHALRWLNHYQYPQSPDQGVLNGVIQHFVNPRQQQKFSAAMATRSWPPELLQHRDEHSAELRRGGYLRPDHWCQQLLNHPAIRLRHIAVTALQPGQPVQARLTNGEQLQADVAILCTAADSRSLAGLDWLPLKVIRGQVSYCQATEESRRWQQAQCHGGYLTPALAGLHCVGATFDLHYNDPAPRDSDDDANLAQLRQYLPQHWQQLGGEQIKVVDRRVAFRCQSNDFLPLCGPWPDTDSSPLQAAAGLYLNIAHGSRGITGTPLCADLLADQISGLPPACDPQIIAALDPGRFIRRKRKKTVSC